MSASFPVLVNDAPVAKRRTRRRLLDRINRISSSPQLTDLDSNQRYSSRYSVSCISLSTAGSSSYSSHVDRPAVRIVEKEVPLSPLKVSEIPLVVVPKSPRCQSQKKSTKNFLESLPGELYLQILGYLEPRELVRCSAVSKTFKRLCFDGQLWKILDTSSFYKDIPVDQLTKLITLSGSFVRYLNLRGCIQLHNEFHAITNTCKNLLAASLEGCSMGRSTVHRLITRNTTLIHLNLSGLDAVSNLTCKNIAGSCQALKTLDVSFCSNMDARGIRNIVESCHSLSVLRAAECAGLEDSITLDAIFKINSLDNLDLTGCSTLTDESIRTLVEGLDPDIDPLTSRTTAPARKLKHLALGRCSELTDLSLKHLAHNIPNLQGLELNHVSEITDEGLTELIVTLPNLTHLDLEECTNITNDALLEMVKAPCAQKLLHLQLSFCENISDEGMIEVVKNCPSLRNIELDNTRISDTFLAEAAETVRHRKIAGVSHNSKVGLRMVVFDCINVNWTGVHSVLGANSNQDPNPKTNLAPSKEVVHLKCYYGWQQTFDQHLKLVLKGDVAGAKWLEDKWADHMTSNDDSILGSRRRRRRAREAAFMGLDADTNDSRRRRRMGGCSVM